jgi:hypothetical protein
MYGMMEHLYRTTRAYCRCVEFCIHVCNSLLSGSPHGAHGLLGGASHTRLILLCLLLLLQFGNS